MHILLVQAVRGLLKFQKLEVSITKTKFADDLRSYN